MAHSRRDLGRRCANSLSAQKEPCLSRRTPRIEVCHISNLLVEVGSREMDRPVVRPRSPIKVNVLHNRYRIRIMIVLGTSRMVVRRQHPIRDKGMGRMEVDRMVSLGPQALIVRDNPASSLCQICPIFPPVLQQA